MDEVGDDSREVDLLSRFPDEILSHVLSFLELEDAVRAKLLSHRWRRLYPANPTITSARFLCSGCYSGSCPEFKEHQDSFMARMDKFMQQFRAPKIEAFLLTVAYDLTDCASLVDEWIRLACLMRAEKIRLWFHYSRRDNYKTYTFPVQLLHSAGTSNLEVLELHKCCFPPLSTLAGPIISLRALRLFSVTFHENNDTFEDIVSYFPNLVALQFSSCRQLNNMRQLVDLSGRLFHLKGLKISISRSVGPKVFEIHDTRLTNFTYVGGVKGLQYLDIYANFSGQCAANFLSNLPEEFPQLDFLSIHATKYSKDFRFPSFISTFKCLKYLSLSLCTSPETDLQKVSKFLQVAPHLQEFHIHFFGESEQWSAAWLEERLLPQHLMLDDFEMHHVHSHVRKIHIGTFSYFGKNEVELIIMLLKFATSLKKMTLISEEAEHRKELQRALAPYFPGVNLLSFDDYNGSH